MGRKVHFAKAAGLKSAFAIGNDKVIVTSFGKGNDAILEKTIENDKVINIEQNIDIELMKRDFNVKRRGDHGRPIITNNPGNREKIGKDMIDRKDQLEMRYFGRTFDDNIHIQLIYNIMDIEKILSIHVNNALYALNNVLNRGSGDFNDTIGMMLAKPYDVFRNSEKYANFNENIKKPQLSYFGGAFFETGFNTKAQKRKTEKKSEKDIYYIISLLGFIRQAAVHGYDWNKTDEAAVALYTLDESFDKLYKNTKFRQEARRALDNLYDTRIDALNSQFLENASKDLTIIFKIYSVTDRSSKIKLIRQYYDFVVKKEYKYLGFSIKQLREMIADDNSIIKSKNYDTMRARLNRLIDFVIYINYIENPEKAKKLVENLRSHIGDDEKSRIYASEAKQLWQLLKGPVMDGILPQMNGKTISSMRADTVISETSVERMKNKTWEPIGKSAHYFIKLVYLLTLFLDGKEINDLVTTLINKMDNISSFNKLLENIDSKPPYEEEYVIFADSGIMAGELRGLNSFARMEKPDASAKRIMFVEAAQMLGDKGTEQELTKYFDDLMDRNSSKEQKGFRNFIRNNVIESSRFKYLVRYCSVEDVIKFSKNKALIKFVLKEIPENQILRYYNSCTGNECREFSSEMTLKLAELIENMSFEQFENVRQNARRNSSEETDKLQKQNIIRLYLTVCYIFFKNLIYVNSRYFLAFYCLERDLRLWDIFENEQSYLMLTEKFMELGKVRKTAKKSKVKNSGEPSYEDAKHIPYNYIAANLRNADNVAIRKFRNITDHIITVQEAGLYLQDIKNPESYYQIYHYIAQRNLCDKLKNSNITEKTKEYFALVKNHGSYCKDFVKALCVPFGYNLPRFKNLSIDGLFDMNDKRENRDTTTEG